MLKYEMIKSGRLKFKFSNLIINKRRPYWKISKSPIGIGGSLAAPPSHTTQRTGPYCAVRLIKADQIQENKLDPVPDTGD
jgi:hypothetical protein